MTHTPQPNTTAATDDEIENNRDMTGGASEFELRLIARIRSDAATLAEKDRQIASLQKQIDVAVEALNQWREVTLCETGSRTVGRMSHSPIALDAIARISAIAAGKETDHA